MLSPVIHVEPGPQALIQLIERKGLLAVQVVQKLFPARAEETLDFSAALRLIRRRVDDEHAHRCRDPRQLRATIDLGVIHVKPDGDATSSGGLAEAVQAGIQALACVKLRVRDESAGVIQNGMQQRLYFAAARALHIWT